MRILFVDDDPTGREVASFNLRKGGLIVDEARDGREALQLAKENPPDVVVTDLRMPRMDGLELARALHARAPEVPVIVITAYGTVDQGLDAMAQGAWSFIEKPFSRQRLQLAVDRALEAVQLRRDNRELRAIERPLVYRSAAMTRVVALVDRIARSNSFKNRPLPPISASGRSRMRSPSVTILTSSISIPGCAACNKSRTWFACHKASALLRVAILRVLFMLNPL